MPWFQTFEASIILINLGFMTRPVSIEMSTTLHLNIDEYNRMVMLGAFDHLNRRIELYRGEIREMNPAGPRHNDLIMYLNSWSVRSTDPKTILVTVQTSLELAGQQSCPEPDLMWLRAARYRDRHPTSSDVKLAIEVSDSSLRTDLTEKATLYAEASVIEFWSVDAVGRCIQVFREPANGKYRHVFVAGLGEQLSPLEPCHPPLDINALFAEQ